MNYESVFKKLDNVIELITFGRNKYNIFTLEELAILEKSLYSIYYSAKLRDAADKYMRETWRKDLETIRHAFSKYSNSYYSEEKLLQMFNDNGNLQNGIVDIFLKKFKDAKFVFDVTIYENDKKVDATTFAVTDSNVNTSMSSIGVNFGYLFGHTTNDNIGPIVHNFIRRKLNEIDIFDDLQQIIDDK